MAFVVALCSCGGAPHETIGASAETIEACVSVCVKQSTDCPTESKLTGDQCEVGCRGKGEDADDIGCGQEWHEYVGCVARHIEDACNELFHCADSKVSWAVCESEAD